MKATGTLYTKLVMRKLQNAERAFQFMLLAGFTQTLTHATAAYVETLSPNESLTHAEIDTAIDKFVRHSNAAQASDITHSGVQKKLDKLIEGATVHHEGLQSFAALGIAQYL